jgi:hypothetical protein
VPKVNQPAGWVIPGIYEKYVPYRPSDKRPDPRLWLGCENAEKLAQLDGLKAAAQAEEVAYKAEALERGESFELPRWYVGGNHFPLPRDHPLRGRDVKRIRVYSNDRVVPVYDD